jgi:Na+/proline symporter
MPTAREAAAEVGDRPTPAVIRWGFYLIVGAVLIGLFGAIYLMLNKETLVTNALEIDNGDRDLTREEVEASVSNGLWVFLVINVIFGAFQALFAFKAKEGQRRARMLVTIVTVMVVLFHFMLVPTLFGQLAGMISAIGAALLYMPASRTFYPPRQPVG